MPDPTKAAQLLARAKTLVDQGADVLTLSRELGITHDQADRLMDRVLDMPRDSHPRPSVEPLDGAPAPVRSGAVADAEPAAAVKPASSVRESHRELAPHGTRAAYQRHYQQKEKPCQVCRDAWNESEKARRAAVAAARAATKERDARIGLGVAAPAPARPAPIPAPAPAPAAPPRPVRPTPAAEPPTRTLAAPPATRRVELYARQTTEYGIRIDGEMFLVAEASEPGEWAPAAGAAS